MISKKLLIFFQIINNIDLLITKKEWIIDRIYKYKGNLKFDNFDLVKNTNSLNLKNNFERYFFLNEKNLKIINYLIELTNQTKKLNEKNIKLTIICETKKKEILKIIFNFEKTIEKSH